MKLRLILYMLIFILKSSTFDSVLETEFQSQMNNLRHQFYTLSGNRFVLNIPINISSMPKAAASCWMLGLIRFIRVDIDYYNRVKNDYLKVRHTAFHEFNHCLLGRVGHMDGYVKIGGLQCPRSMGSTYTWNTYEISHCYRRYQPFYEIALLMNLPVDKIIPVRYNVERRNL